ncbi:hypothetical protein FF38_01760 [Lucilia cuprina]|uniref:Uncharacterized protein n=1 Tax=Lucilia cuprina TaxID=7375 RepID=A0A0L0CNI3_LUCCU|nr:hypothetical protein FF38_01760 [Lucilia cuprina]
MGLPPPLERLLFHYYTLHHLSVEGILDLSSCLQPARYKNEEDCKDEFKQMLTSLVYKGVKEETVDSSARSSVIVQPPIVPVTAVTEKPKGAKLGKLGEKISQLNSSAYLLETPFKPPKHVIVNKGIFKRIHTRRLPFHIPAIQKQTLASMSCLWNLLFE